MSSGGFMDSIIIGTGSYETVKSGNRVSITGDGGHAWRFFGRSYKQLAPKLETYTPYAAGYKELKKLPKDSLEYQEKRRQIEDAYIESYYNIRLKNLNVDDLFEDLYIRFGERIILLCHESVDEFCHRRLVADYVQLKTGLYIPELEIDKNGETVEVEPISYQKRLLKVMEKK